MLVSFTAVDPEYQAFLAALESGSDPAKLAPVDTTSKPEGPTPLVQFLIDKQSKLAKVGKGKARSKDSQPASKAPNPEPSKKKKTAAKDKCQQSFQDQKKNKKADTKPQSKAKADAAATGQDRKPVQILQRRASEAVKQAPKTTPMAARNTNAGSASGGAAPPKSSQGEAAKRSPKTQESASGASTVKPKPRPKSDTPAAPKRPGRRGPSGKVQAAGG